MSQTNSFKRVSNEPMPRIREMSIHEFISIPITERPVLLDVRSEDEWGEGHAEGAILLTRRQGRGDFLEIASDRTTPVVCCCADGKQSKLVAAQLVRLGYTHVASLAGGFQAWLSAKESVVKPLIGSARSS